MSVTLHLPPEVEAGLVAQAQASGMTVEAYLLSIDITIMGIEPMLGWTGARRNRALTRLADLQVSVRIDGSGIVTDSIRRRLRREAFACC